MPSVVPVTTRRTVLSPTAAMLFVVSPCLAAGLLFTDGQAEVSGAAGTALAASGKRLYVVYLLGRGEGIPASSLAQYVEESMSVTIE